MKLNFKVAATGLLGVLLPLFTVEQCLADIVWATKDCSLGTCNVSGNSAGPGFFRLAPAGSFSWSASYTGGGNPGHFWVGNGSTVMNGTRLSTTAGQMSGNYTLPTGTHYISIKYIGMTPGTYSVFGANVWGDPHITTTNGVHYDFQGAGEFTLLKYGDGFEVQSRMHPIATSGPLSPNPHTGLSSCVSINTAAALKVGDQRLTYQPKLNGEPDPSGMELRVDGKLVDVGSDGIVLDDRSSLRKDEDTGEVRVVYVDESSVRIIPTWWAAKQLWYLDYDFSSPQESVGIAGQVPQDSWLPLLADGSSVGTKPSSVHDRYEILYVKFADSWRVKDGNTLFDYASGTSSATFTMEEWPGEQPKCELPFQVPLSGVSLEVANEACASVVVPHLKNGCVQDVSVTGDTVFGRSYLKGQGPVRAIIKLPVEEAKCSSDQDCPNTDSP